MPDLVLLSQPPRSRFRATPRGAPLAVTARDVALFRVLDRYRYLPANFLLAFVGGHRDYHKTRLTALFHEGYLSKPAQQWESVNARYRPDTYELGAKAEAVLRANGAASPFRVGAGGPFRHEALVCLIAASFELSARRHGIGLRGWKDVLLGAPETTRAAPAPFAIPLQFPPASSPTLRPDGLPFGLIGQRALWFGGFEADRQTEPLHPYDLRTRSSSILGKLLAYQRVVGERLFERWYGLPNLLVPIVTTSASRCDHMLELALEVSHGQGYKWLLFQARPDFDSLDHAVSTAIDLLTTPWRRAGHPPLTLLDALNSRPEAPAPSFAAAP